MLDMSYFLGRQWPKTHVIYYMYDYKIGVLEVKSLLAVKGSQLDAFIP